MQKDRAKIIDELNEMIAHVKSKSGYGKLDELLIINWERSKRILK